MSNLNIEVAYAIPEKQYLLSLQVMAGTIIKDAIIASGILILESDIDLEKNNVGIYGRIAKLSDTLRSGDRIEIYRPLISDPKELRRTRSKKVKHIKNNYYF
ncbi:hypothetical protein GFV14_00036 [Candidatus Hartigia pinicola]|nr:hypothetical protein GFV14_00036 [Candidatus Hartigia pinicola]